MPNGATNPWSKSNSPSLRRIQGDSIVAFSGEHDYLGDKVTEASLNGFPSGAIADKIKEDPYRILVVANKFQTG